MKLSSKRIALLTGASVSAFGLAAPAFAATTTSPGTSSVVGPAATTSDTLTICALDDSCFFGVEATNSPAATAIVNSVPTGEILQAGTGGNVELTLTNPGDSEIGAHATATSAAGAATAVAQIGTALSPAVLQSIAAISAGTANFTNDGSLLIDAVANASAPAGSAVANATIDFGVIQQVVAATAVANYTNSGAVALSANAVAVGSALASANASVADAQYQIATGITAAAANFDNSGSLAINAVATATGSAANAHAFAEYLMEQDVTAGTTATASIVNSGTMTLAASAHANAATGPALAAATANEALVQEVDSGGTGIAKITNSGSLAITANAAATGGSAALAGAFITEPIIQRIDAVTGTAIFSNTAAGVVNMTANAIASATGIALAAATIEGIIQTAGTGGAAFTFVNDGTISAHAVASAIGSTGAASAAVVGLSQNGGLPVALNDTNSGVFNVTASAIAPGTAVANAVGISVNVVGPTPLLATDEALVDGTLTNSGTLSVVAKAAGGSFTTPTVGGGTTTVFQDSAHATGIAINSGANNLTVTNTGTIDVDAITKGGPATATGIRVAGNGTGLAPAAGEVFTFNNDGGTIRVRQSTDGGDTWTRGMAIDVSAAPNGSVINLLGTSGDGNIYGNIEVAAGDTINVEDGFTYFDGIINPSFLPAGGVTAADLDSGLFGNGTLNIVNGGNLELADPRVTGDPAMYDGPAYAFVNTLNVDADSTLTLQLQPAAGGTQPVGTYPQIYTDTATLAGTLALDVHPANRLFADTYTWLNVIDASPDGLGGTEFDQCALVGDFAGSALLNSPVCTYDQPNGNVSVALSRIAFNAVTGLTRNEAAVATGIENVYSIDLTGPFANLVGELFTLNPANYLDALDQLSGVQYANYVHAVRNNSFVLNSQISDQLDCSATGGIEACREPKQGGRVWFMGGYNHAKLDSNSDAIGYTAKNWDAMIGADYLLGNFSVGAFAGYRHLNVDFPDSFGSQIKGKGWQAGLDATYDVGNFYGRAIGSYSHLNGDSSRHIDIGTIATDINGSPDMNIWSFYGEAGGRFDLGGSWVTPYAAIDYTSMHLKGFREDGGLGADLELPSQTEHQASGVIGLKWSGNLGGIVPEAKVAYRRDFGSDLGVDLRFADAPAGSDFRKEEDRKDGSVIAGLSLAGALGSNVTGRIGYQGRFNSEVTDHAVYGSLTLFFGGAGQTWTEKEGRN